MRVAVGLLLTLAALTAGESNYLTGGNIRGKHKRGVGCPKLQKKTTTPTPSPRTTTNPITTRKPPRLPRPPTCTYNPPSGQLFASEQFPKKYPKNMNCFYSMTAAQGKKVKLTFHVLEVSFLADLDIESHI